MTKLINLTPASRRTVLKIARHDVLQAAFVAVVRAENRASRAIDVYAHGGGSSRRVYWCPRTGATIDTESARYPMTVHAADAINEHRREQYNWLRAEHADLIAEIEQEAARGTMITWAPTQGSACAA